MRTWFELPIGNSVRLPKSRLCSITATGPVQSRRSSSSMAAIGTSEPLVRINRPNTTPRDQWSESLSRCQRSRHLPSLRGMQSSWRTQEQASHRHRVWKSFAVPVFAVLHKHPVPAAELLIPVRPTPSSGTKNCTVSALPTMSSRTRLPNTARIRMLASRTIALLLMPSRRQVSWACLSVCGRF